MTFAELVADVQNIIQDSSYSETTIKSLLNRALLVVASGIILPGKYQLSPPLPDLYSVGTIDTTVGSAICDLPSDFNRDLVQVLNSGYDVIPIVPSFRKFLMSYPEQTAGSVFIVARNGSTLLYRDIPSAAETLTVHYYKTPDTMTLTTDEPEGVPVILHRPLLVGYTCAQIFNEIEDGIEGQKINTASWNTQFQQGLVDLGIIIGHDAEPDYMDDVSERIS